ncbi:unnamed protein product [Moneuplotes crassus]|uniref:Uncharacterized protein n=1 Tax=Euplotes crassus TaxID=5936 RepID=A0AAD1U0K0_EUPCR|nr:unnamed protein product [Moneuplotes crassus]
MSADITTQSLWDDSFCTVSEYYSQSPSTNDVYKWHNSESILANSQEDRSSRKGKLSINKMNTCNIKEPKMKYFNKIASSCEVSSELRECSTSKNTANIKGLVENITRPNKFGYSKFRLGILKLSETKSKSWKERCNQSQTIDSPLLLMNLKK